MIVNAYNVSDMFAVVVDLPSSTFSLLISKLSDTSEARFQFKPRRRFVHPAYDEETDTHDVMIVGRYLSEWSYLF